MTVNGVTMPSGGFRLFTCTDVCGQSQLNAWGSWKRVAGASVSVFGDAPGVSDQAKDFGFRTISPVKRNEFGRPLLGWIFQRMTEESIESVLGYINSDIILLPGLEASIAAVRAEFDAFLIVARRWNIDSLPALDFASGWAEKLRNLVIRQGELFTPYGIDLFVFSRGLFREIPPFGLGSDYWDNYLVMSTRRKGYPVIDVTQQVMLVHQNHSLGRYHSATERRQGPEGLRAFALAGDSRAMLGRTIDATHVMAHGELRPADTAHVTAVIPHDGDTRRICWCLRHLEHQTYAQSFLDLIVVSNDLAAPLRYLEADFPSLRVVTEAKRGSGAALNKGISCANSEVVALFDHDMFAAVHCLERGMRVMKDQPECQVVACRIAPIFASGKMGYLGRAVEWFDAVTHYNTDDWAGEPGTFMNGALLVRKEVFAQCGYFSELCPEAARQEWARRVINACIRVAFCHEAVVRRHTLKSIAELKHKKENDARADCILNSLRRSEPCRVVEVIQDEGFALLRQFYSLRREKRIPARYRPAMLLLSLWSSVWRLKTKLQYRSEAKRVVRRRRQELDRTVQPRAGRGAFTAGLPFRWFGPRAASRRMSSQDAAPRSHSS